MSITTNCMTVNLSLGIWQGYRLDKAASKKVTDDAGAEADAARVNKHLIPKESLKDIVAMSGQIRQHFYSKTLPWKDNGDRLLTRKLYAPFVETHQALVGEFRTAVEDFLSKTYPQAKMRAEFRMGDLFNPADYPASSELRHKFYVALDIDAVSEAKDFRVALDKESVATIRSDIETATNERLEKAMRSVWERLAQTVGHFAEKMAGDSVFRDSTITNLEELIDLLPGLNITADPNLTAVYEDLRRTLIGYDPKDLRKEPTVRYEAASEAQRIMQEMTGFMSAFGEAAE